VPYKVSLRWLFYRLLQAGIYNNKNDYNALKHITKRARKEFYNGWNPETLVDDTRRAYIRGSGYLDEYDFLNTVGGMECVLDKWQNQDYYLECWFEARAMYQQFEYYTRYITLRPFGGDPSIHYKWETAKHLSMAAERYRKPIVILYFGDLDPKGMEIPENAVRDIFSWTDENFITLPGRSHSNIKFIRAGLNPGDEVDYNIPENPERPGTYQWEALDDETAREVIETAVYEFVDHGLQNAAVAEQHEITGRFKENWTEFINGL
jgi:hypothetical protein